MVGFIQNEVFPLLATERLLVLQNQPVGRDADVKRIRLAPTLSFCAPFFRRTCGSAVLLADRGH